MPTDTDQSLRRPRHLALRRRDRGRLPPLASSTRQGLADLDRLPFSIRVLLENALRHVGRGFVSEAHVRDLAGLEPDRPRAGARCRSCPRGSCCRTSPACPAWSTWPPCATPWDGCRATPTGSIRSCPATWSSTTRSRWTPTARIGRSSSTSSSSSSGTCERYQLLKFAQRAFDNFRVVPPGTGIVHQVNLEYLAPVVQLRRPVRRARRPIPTPSSAPIPTRP